MSGPAIVKLFCTKCGLCWKNAPSVFYHDGDYHATVIDPNGDAGIIKACIDACPGQDPRNTPPTRAKAIVLR